MRSLKALAERKIKRSTRRRAARRLHRSLNANPKDRKTNRGKAKAQEPKEKMKYGKRYRIATLNVHGMKRIGKREEVEEWMKRKGIHILVIQETATDKDSREMRGEYTWYFSGEKKTLQGWTYGVGVIINNEIVKNIDDIIPITDRLIVLRLKGTMTTTIIGTYMPQAHRPKEEKDAAYKELESQIRKYKAQGPIYIMGDMNARIQKPEGNEERRHIGTHTFEPETAGTQSLEVQENRTMMINMCKVHNLRVMNTMFRKQNKKLATYMKVGTTVEHEIRTETHEQIYYIMTTERLKNTVRNVETDSESNIHSDHYPVWAEIQIRLKAMKKGGNKRKKYRESTQEEKDELNDKVREEIEVERNEENNEDRVRRVLKRGVEQLKEAEEDEKKTNYSDATKQVLEERRKAITEKNVEEYDRLTKEFRKSKEKDKRESTKSSRILGRRSMGSERNRRGSKRKERKTKQKKKY